jgi:hypothetical protein
MAASSSIWRGVRYAFGRGLDPRKKDGVRAHPFAFVFGVLLHASIAAALASLLLSILHLAPVPTLRILLLAVLGVGIVSGAALVGRRLRDPVLQAISVSDDYLSALLVLVFVAAAGVSLVTPAGANALYLSTAALVLYAPFGKIRHCVLFFVTRARFGAFIGSRGVLIQRPHR